MPGAELAQRRVLDDKVGEVTNNQNAEGLPGHARDFGFYLEWAEIWSTRVTSCDLEF